MDGKRRNSGADGGQRPNFTSVFPAKVPEEYEQWEAAQRAAASAADLQRQAWFDGKDGAQWRPPQKWIELVHKEAAQAIEAERAEIERRRTGEAFRDIKGRKPHSSARYDENARERDRRLHAQGELEAFRHLRDRLRAAGNSAYKASRFADEMFRPFVAPGSMERVGSVAAPPSVALPPDMQHYAATANTLRANEAARDANAGGGGGKRGRKPGRPPGPRKGAEREQAEMYAADEQHGLRMLAKHARPRGRSATATELLEDVEWAAAHALVPVDSIQVEDVPSRECLFWLRLAKHQPNNFASQLERVRSRVADEQAQRSSDESERDQLVRTIHAVADAARKAVVKSRGVEWAAFDAAQRRFVRVLRGDAVPARPGEDVGDADQETEAADGYESESAALAAADQP